MLTIRGPQEPTAQKTHRRGARLTGCASFAGAAGITTLTYLHEHLARLEDATITPDLDVEMPPM